MSMTVILFDVILSKDIVRLGVDVQSSLKKRLNEPFSHPNEGRALNSIPRRTEDISTIIAFFEF